jgi:putative ABC transport system permease protein
LAPALQATRADVLPALKESGNTVSGANSGIQNSFLALQIAFTMILLTGGGLFGRSVMKAWTIDAGFRTEGLLTASFSPPPSGTESLTRFRRAQTDLTERLRATAGVKSVTLTTNPPFDNLHVKVQVEADQIQVTADRQGVDRDFFQTTGIPLLSGREFDSRDVESAPKVAIVNQALASRLWPGADPTGRTILVQKSAMRVVGVARNSKYGSVWEDPLPSLYVACSQLTGAPGYLIARTGGNPKDNAAALTRAWSDILPRSPLYDFSTANDLRNVALAPQRMAVWVFGSFGLVAIILASVGLYSSVSCAVARRTREIGIRMAMGAKPATVVTQLMVRSMTVAAAGLAAGTAISALLAPSVAGYVRGVPVYDRATFAFVIALVGMVALLASAIPARRAARIDPQAALRSE